MMKQILYVIAFYAFTSLLIFVLNILSPNAQDGGLGWAGMALLLLPVVCLLLIGINIYWGFSIGNQYFVIAGIHFLVLFLLITRLFL